MEISIQIPDEVGERLHSRWQDLPRHALEALVIDAYRRDVLTTAEVQGILGLSSRQHRRLPQGGRGRPRVHVAGSRGRPPDVW